MSIPIQFTGHNMEISQAIRHLTEEKLQKLERHFDQMTHINMVFNVQKIEQIAEATIVVPGQKLHACASSNDLYKSIDQLIQKLDRQIIRYKEKRHNH